MADRRGPRTAQGKAAVSRNAIKHGINSPVPVLPGMENERDWLRHYDGLTESLQPEGYFEELLVYRIALIAWRLERVHRYELAAIADHIQRVEDDRAVSDAYAYGTKAVLDAMDGKPSPVPDPTEDELQHERERRVLPRQADLDRIMRYESQLHRQLLQTIHELEAVQARRRGEPAHLARLDISSPPAS